MARVYISFLGTNDYVECRYLDEFDTPEPVRFVQEATIGTICRGWGPGDRITIFTTTDAEKKNWEDNGHYDKDNKRYKECKGLKRCLEELKLTAPFANVHIPDGHSTEEMWDIFQKVLILSTREMKLSSTSPTPSVPSRCWLLSCCTMPRSSSEYR